MTTVVDTDALLGLVDQDDAHHETATNLTQALADHNATTYILPTTLCEFALLSSRHIGRQPAQQAVAQLLQSTHVILPITDVLTQEAVALYQAQTSKEESLFDCYVMVAAQHVQADGIFSFDHGYPKNGFRLMTALLGR
ncbi:MAG: PIN domain-containing protein [Chloroflexota bacterium]|nr:PIN domain-containing protein [Chloroflexota bacterium]